MWFFAVAGIMVCGRINRQIVVGETVHRGAFVLLFSPFFGMIKILPWTEPFCGCILPYYWIHLCEEREVQRCRVRLSYYRYCWSGTSTRLQQYQSRFWCYAQDEYTPINSQYAIGIHGYILVYSVTSRSTFDMIQIVYDKIVDFCGVTDIPCVIVGTKVDLAPAG